MSTSHKEENIRHKLVQRGALGEKPDGRIKRKINHPWLLVIKGRYCRSKHWAEFSNHATEAEAEKIMRQTTWVKLYVCERQVFERSYKLIGF